LVFGEGRNLLVNAEITGDPHNERRKWVDYLAVQFKSSLKIASGLTADSLLISSKGLNGA